MNNQLSEFHTWIKKDPLFRPINILYITLVLTIIHKLIILTYGKVSLPHFDKDHLILIWSKVIVDQYLVHIIPTLFILVSAKFYFHFAEKFELLKTTKSILTVELTFLPILLSSFLLFNPMVILVKNLFVILTGLHAIFNMDRVYKATSFLQYIIPTTLIGYAVLNWYIFKSQHKKSSSSIEFVEAHDELGSVPLKVEDVYWFERTGRKYFAVVDAQRLRMKENISTLEKMLAPEKFVRLNRYTLANISFIKNYSYWQDEKYIVRMKDSNETEFPMTRERLKNIRDTLRLRLN